MIRQKHIPLPFLLLLWLNVSLAQNETSSDSIKPLDAEKIEVIKAFEANLMETEMILFRPSLPEVIPIKRIYEYDVTIIPYTIQYPDPVIRPIAIKKEPAKTFLSNYAKIGYGNIKNPFTEIRVYRKFTDLVDWRLAIDYAGADNSMNNSLQKYSNLNISSSQDFNIMETERLATTIGGGIEKRYFYYQGSDRLIAPDAEESLRNIGRFNLDLVFFNSEEKDINLDYKVQLINKFTSLSDLDKSEFNTRFIASATKTNHENLSFTFSGGIDYNTIDGNGDVFSFIDPKLILSGDRYGLDLGVKAIQGDEKLHVFPDIELTYAIDHKKLQAYIGSDLDYTRNNFRNITQINPFATSIDSLPSTITSDIYGGVKGDIAGLIYNAKVGYKNIDNHAIYNVDFSDDQRRINTSVTNLNSVYISGSIQYPIQEWITAGANTTQNFYSGIEAEELWSIPSLEFSAFASISLLENKILLTPILYIRDRANALNQEGNNIEMDDLIDFNVQLEIRPLKQFSIWLRGNNLFDKSYRRWFGYENYGIHFQGGIKTIF
jgi:hypothetical protein